MWRQEEERSHYKGRLMSHTVYEIQGGTEQSVSHSVYLYVCVCLCMILQAPRYVGFCVLKALCFIIQLFPVSLLASCREIDAPVN